MPEDEPLPGPMLTHLPPEQQYRNIMEFLYTEDGAHKDKNEWRRALIEVLRFNIIDRH